MKKKWQRLALLGSLLYCITGCASLPHNNPLPQGMELRKVAGADAGAPFSYKAPDGLLAFSDGRLQVVDLKSGAKRDLAAERPIALAFAPGAPRLAAAFPQGNRSVVRIYDAAGKTVGETTVGGKVTEILWRDDKEVVMTALSFIKYSFGSQLDSYLYRWDGSGEPIGSSVNCTTVRPHIAKLPEEVLLQTLSMALSPYGDEVVVTKLKDPPMFTPFLQIGTHNLDTGGGEHLGETAMRSGGPLYSPDGKKILVGTAGSVTRWLPVAGGKWETGYPSQGLAIALSPSGSYALVDGHLYHKEKEIAAFPPETKGAFSSDGTALVLRYREALYLLTGINDQLPPPLRKEPRLMELRRLRSNGLITAEELEKAIQALPAAAQ